MSISFGGLNSFADFFAGLDASLVYVRSASFWYGPLREPLLEELSAIRAWTFAGRKPRWAERDASAFPHVLYRAREDMREEEPPDDCAQIELASRVTWLFQNWPESEELLRRGHHLGSATAPRSPALSEFPPVVEGIRVALAPLTSASVSPPASAFASKQPMRRDTMSTPQWVRWVLLPRLEDVMKGVVPVPANSQLMMLARGLALDEAMWPLLYALGGLDELFRQQRSMPIALEPLR